MTESIAPVIDIQAWKDLHPSARMRGQFLREKAMSPTGGIQGPRKLWYNGREVPGMTVDLSREVRITEPCKLWVDEKGVHIEKNTLEYPRIT